MGDQFPNTEYSEINGVRFCRAKNAIPCSANFVTGFTLYDLVSYNTKHKEANGEGNRDGTNDNVSWNCGVEGLTEDSSIESIRTRQIKNFFAVTFLSIGAPMISMGDEVKRTQLGNNNAYCHDNELTWFDWNLAEKNTALFRFVKLLISFRLKRDLSKDEYSMNLKQLLEQATVTWHGVNINKPDWSEDSHTIALTVQSLSGKIMMHYMINAYSSPLPFELPTAGSGKEYRWKRWMDTALESPQDISVWNDAKEVKDPSYSVGAHSMVILLAQL